MAKQAATTVRGMIAMSSERVRWMRLWEADLTRQDHAALTCLLAAVYPDHMATFRDGRDHSGARPEGRIVGLVNGVPVAHLGFLRRTLRLDDGDDSVLCGDVGLVGVHPALRRSGLGLRLLAETEAVFQRLGLPYGFLTCRPAVVSFYERGGWCRVAGQVTRSLDEDSRPQVDKSPALVLPVRGLLPEWPSKRVVVRDGLAV